MRARAVFLPRPIFCQCRDNCRAFPVFLTFLHAIQNGEAARVPGGIAIVVEKPDMTRIVTLAVLCLCAGPAFAAPPEKGRTIACFDKVYVEPEFSTSKELIQPAKRVYVKRGGLIELVEYAAVYREHKTKVKDGYWVLREIVCKKKR